MFNQVQKLASAIHNNIVSGLAGYHINSSISLEQLEDAVVDERLQIIREYSLKGIISPNDLYLTITCIPVDCIDIERCNCKVDGTPTAHFEIPQLLLDLGDASISYLGSTDMELPFIYYTSPQTFRYHKYKKRGKDKPYVWIDTTPNEHSMYDCFVFNAPLLSQVTIIAVFKDLRQLQELEDLKGCCVEVKDDNKSFINADIVDRVSKKMILYYRQLFMPPIPNNQSYTPA